MRKLEQKDDEWEVGIEEFLAPRDKLDLVLIRYPDLLEHATKAR